MSRPLLNRRLAGLGTTIFAEMSARAVATGSINLGQGFPDRDGPIEIARAAADAVVAGRGNQYPPGPGIPELRQAIAGHARRFYGMRYDPDTEVLVTAGATEAVAAAMLALVEPGDEVIAFEPYYDSYAANIAMAGGVRVPVTLRPPDFRPDIDELADAITDRTRLILVNTPHNPTGSVFTRDELAAIAELAVERDLLVVTDEVYEHIVFAGEHVPLASFPGMRERTVTVSSAGKTFSFTGWKIGWVKAAPELVSAVRTAKQFLTYVSGGPFQYAIAQALALPDEYYAALRDDLRARRDLFTAGLAEIGFEVYQPRGTYFVTADIKPLGEPDGIEFCRSLPERAGVVAIPAAVFYDHTDAARTLVRFAFCKRPEVLAEALARLSKLLSRTIRGSPARERDRGPRPTMPVVPGPWRPAAGTATMGSMVLLILAVLGVVGVPFAIAVARADDINAWLAVLPQRLRGRGWGLLLAPVAVFYALVAPSWWLAPVEIALCSLAIIAAPRFAAKTVPYALLVLGGYGLKLMGDYHGGYAAPVQYGLVPAGGYFSWRTALVLPQAIGFFAAGLWLLVLVRAPGSERVRALAARWLSGARGGIRTAHALLLLPVVVLAMDLLGPSTWFGVGWVTGQLVTAADVLVAAACLVLVFRSRVWAATLADAGLLVLGGYGILIAMSWPSVPGHWYGFVHVYSSLATAASGVQGAALLALGLWLAPCVMREHRGYPELAARTRQLTERVQTLTRTRSDAVDTAAAELRRIERDLHDGAQARLVAVGMSLQAAERLFATSPEAALALVAEAKQTSSRALAELRDLVRGIYPPVLADRGLADAIRALALDSPVPAQLDIDLPGDVEMPVGSAVYFAVAETLANVAKHAAARGVRVSLRHAGGMLRAEVIDDGAGGADPAGGTGLAGVEHRLAAFDGILAVSSPPGGPTIVVIEVPCALSSPKTSTC